MESILKSIHLASTDIVHDDGTFNSLHVYDDVVIGGDLIVNGETIELDHLNVEDNTITLNSSVTGTPTLNASITINRGSSTDANIKWNETTDKFMVGLVGSEQNILTEGGNTNVSSLSINNVQIIDSSRNMSSMNLVNTSGLEANTLNYFDSITLEDVVGNSLAVLGKHGTGQNAKLELYDTTDGAPSRKVFITSNPNNNGYINMPFAFGTSGVMQATSQVQIDSTTKGFLPPRMTQTQKLAISSPATGLTVYDTTSNLLSYHNGTNWFVPSYSSFKLTVADTTPGVILWDSVTTSNDARISFNSGTGVFTFLDQGTYEIHCSANFYMTENEPERSVQILFVDNSTGTTHSSANTCITILLESLATFTNASINSILTISPSSSSTYRFNFTSFANNTIKLGVQSHGFIKRIL
jgi:hypothetical protein